MATRSYSGLLVLEDIFDYVPTGDPDIVGLANMIFNPVVPIVEDDCKTSLGEIKDLNYESEGLIELANNLVINKGRIEQLLSRGVYKIAIRNTSTCISNGGVCKKCYQASFRDKTSAKVKDLVTITPIYDMAVDVFTGSLEEGSIADVSQSYTLSIPDYYYDNAVVYKGGVLLTPSEYKIQGQVITFTENLLFNQNAVVRMTATDRRPFLYKLARTYAGALLGIRELPSPLLPLRTILLSSLLPENKIQSVLEYSEATNVIPPPYIEYAGTIKDPLEKGLFLIAINCVYAPAT